MCEHLSEELAGTLWGGNPPPLFPLLTGTQSCLEPSWFQAWALIWGLRGTRLEEVSPVIFILYDSQKCFAK